MEHTAAKGYIVNPGYNKKTNTTNDCSCTLISKDASKTSVTIKVVDFLLSIGSNRTTCPAVIDIDGKRTCQDHDVGYKYPKRVQFDVTVYNSSIAMRVGFKVHVFGRFWFYYKGECCL